MSDHLRALHTSVEHLRRLAAPLDDAALTGPAYPSDWTVAQVLSHLGSSATIFQHLVDDSIHARDALPDLHQSVWSEWDAKSPGDQRDHALEADANLLARLEELDETTRASVRLSMGPLQLDFDGFVALRLNEHVLHTWDVEVALDPAATLSREATGVVIDNLEMIARWSARPPNGARSLRVHTTDPERRFDLVVEDGALGFGPGDTASDPDLVMSAEAFVRLVYGRLDPDHTPAGLEGAVLDQLRATFPGI